MNRITHIVFVAVLGCLVGPSFSLGSIIEYTAVGYVTDKQNMVLPISGDVYIDNQLREWAGNVPGQPTVVQDQIGIFSYQYYITAYSLRVGEYSFSGNKGMFYMPLFRSPTLEDWGAGDLMWFLEDGTETSQWAGWIGEHFTFYDIDETPLEYSEYDTLADTINLVGLLYLPNDAVLPDGPPFDLWLHKNGEKTPAPEPSTLLLLGASLAGIVCHRKHRRRQIHV